MTKTCIFGHGPDGVPSGVDVFRYQLWLCLLIDIQIREGRLTFVSGARPGVDLWCAAYIADLKRSNRGLRLHVFTDPLPDEMDEPDVKLKRATLLKADVVSVVNDEAEKTAGMIGAASALLSVDYPEVRTGYLPLAEEKNLRLMLFSPEELILQ